ncbi:MAG: histidine phosphatase family protein [Bacteroidota bacterium]|nr:histidine phosphatase family protein [Bacteroidota bacterium]
MEREIYIIRHGQTDHNAKGIVQGKGVNLSLNDRGRKQAQAFFDAYKDVPFDKLYSSSLLRAQETISAFRALGIPHESRNELDEISWGDLEGTTATMESDLVFQSLIKRWREGDIHAKPSPTGESPFELQQRQKKFMEYLLSTDHKKVLIATHGRFIRAFMCTLTGKPLSEMETFTHSNLCLYKVKELAGGEFEIVLHCETEHLSAI